MTKLNRASKDEYAFQEYKRSVIVNDALVLSNLSKKKWFQKAIAEQRKWNINNSKNLSYPQE